MSNYEAAKFRAAQGMLTVAECRSTAEALVRENNA